MGLEPKKLGLDVDRVPDDVFERPGFTMKRYGRAIEFRTHQSSEQWSARLKRLWQMRPEMHARIQHVTEEVSALIRKYSSLDLVGHLWLRHAIFNAEEYKETDSQQRPHFVEHATMLQLRESVPSLTDELVVSEQDLTQVEKLLTEIFELTTTYYLAESANPDLHGLPSRLDELRYRTLLREMTVGPPAYTHHWIAVLKGIFGNTNIETYLQEILGVTLEQTLSCIEAISVFMGGALQERMKAAKVSHRKMQEDLRSYMQTGKFSGNAEDKAVLDRIRNLRAKDRKRFMASAAMQWITVAIADVLALEPAALANEAAIPEDVVSKLLETFALGFGTIPSDYVIPSPVPPIRVRPIVRMEDKYMCLLPFNLIWAVKPRFEEALKQSGRWNSYQKHRGNFLVDAGLNALQRLLPGAQVHRALKYPIGSNDEAELDGMVLYDRYIFLIEGKAEEFGAARRGGKERIKRGLAELVRDPSQQGARARDYISRENEPKFQPLNGAEFVVDKSRFTEFCVITLTLDSLDVFTPELHLLQATGALGSHDLPWAVCLTDLMAISEILRLPIEFTHFLRWRLSITRGENISAGSDELNWLAIYLKEGPELLRVPGGFTGLDFTSYTDSFDEYFLHQGGFRTRPAPCPSQRIPKELQALLMGLVSSSQAGFTAPAEALLDLGFSERERLAHHLAASRKRNLSETVFEAEGLRVGVSFGERSSNQLKMNLGAGGGEGRSTLLAAVDSSDLSRIYSWLWIPRKISTLLGTQPQ